jgi:chromosome segregation ATPase
LAAGAFGFLFGWILSSLIKNEKLNEKYSLLQEECDLQKAELNQALSDVITKDDEIERLQKELQQTQKELLIKNMDLEEYEKGSNTNSSSTQTDLELEINSLKEEINEYKYLENENSILHNELKLLEDEKDELLSKIELLEKELEESYKQSNIYLDDTHSKSLIKLIKKTKKELKKMQRILKNSDLKA